MEDLGTMEVGEGAPIYREGLSKGWVMIMCIGVAIRGPKEVRDSEEPWYKVYYRGREQKF